MSLFTVVPAIICVKTEENCKSVSKLFYLTDLNKLKMIPERTTEEIVYCTFEKVKIECLLDKRKNHNIFSRELGELY